MDEKSLEVLEKYDLEVVRTRKGRGVYYVETSNGLHVLKAFQGAEEKIEKLWKLAVSLENVRFFTTDLPVRDQEGKFIVKDGEGNSYVLKAWGEGRECDPRNELDVSRTMEGLGIFHVAAEGAWDFSDEGEQKKYEGPNLVTELEKRTRELKKVQSFIRKKTKKSTFEFCYLEAVPKFLLEASEIILRLKECGYEAVQRNAVESGGICHGEFTQHNVLFDRSKMILTNFEHACLDIPCMDVALFLRKVMEKQGWKIPLGEKLLSAYEVVRPMEETERLILALRLSYPEKLWKIANHYYHANKAWIPAKDLEKLKVFVSQQKDRELFVQKVIL